MKQSAKNISFSGSIPVNYDDGMGEMFFEPYATEMSNRVALLQPSAVLEIACGTGRLTKYLSQQLPGASITATDLNPAMLEFAQKRFSGLSNVRWEIADALSVPFADQSFDCVVVQFGVMFYPDKIQGFRESFRVLRSGGKFIFATWKSLADNEIAQIANDTVKIFFPNDPPVFFNIPFSYYDKDQIRKDVMNAGFGSVEIEDLSLSGSNISAENAARGLFDGTPIINFLNERAPDKIPEIKQRFVDAITKVYGKDHLSIPSSALIVTAER
ncbi:class I SAM-dependent methyltransferase [Taibaiella soli]|nr:class I SAM-dependent methyltransferase [Taibaiella soli]